MGIPFFFPLLHFFFPSSSDPRNHLGSRGDPSIQPTEPPSLRSDLTSGEVNASGRSSAPSARSLHHAGPRPGRPSDRIASSRIASSGRPVHREVQVPTSPFRAGPYSFLRAVDSPRASPFAPAQLRPGAPRRIGRQSPPGPPLRPRQPGRRPAGCLSAPGRAVGAAGNRASKSH